MEHLNSGVQVQYTNHLTNLLLAVLKLIYALTYRSLILPSFFSIYQTVCSEMLRTNGHHKPKEHLVIRVNVSEFSAFKSCEIYKECMAL